MVGVGVEQGGRGPSRGRRGTPEMASAPAASSSQSCPGVAAPPGKRQAMPMIATGSVAAAAAGAETAGGAGAGVLACPASSACRCRARAAGVG